MAEGPIYASLVYDGGDTIHIPASMGSPCSNQMRGTPHEQLGEGASRICYDSLGLDEEGKPRGRASEKLHAHILEVRNHSVYEHGNFTIGFDLKKAGLNEYLFVLGLINRKGVWIDANPDNGDWEITVNYRAILEWGRHSKRLNKDSAALGRVFEIWASKLAPMIVPVTSEITVLASRLLDCSYHKTEELNEDQAWITLYLYGSRGWSHEQVRHRYAMSQRSTRYVDESESPYVAHPLVEAFLADPRVDSELRGQLNGLISQSMTADRQTYRELVAALETYASGVFGLGKTDARKQARGAARGYLGNALATEMFYSAPVSGWQWILSQRANAKADAEIRRVYEPALAALQSSRYGHFFEQYKLVPSPDGLGKVLA